MTGQCTAKRHGTVTAYKKHRCRCPEARALMVPCWRRWNRNRKPRPSQALLPDPVAIEQACAGRRVRLIPAERRKAIDRLDDGSRSAREIAELLHITRRTVERRRAARRATQEVPAP